MLETDNVVHILIDLCHVILSEIDCILLIDNSLFLYLLNISIKNNEFCKAVSTDLITVTFFYVYSRYVAWVVLHSNDLRAI